MNDGADPGTSILFRPGALDANNDRAISRRLAQRELGIGVRSFQRRYVAQCGIEKFVVCIHGRGKRASTRTISEIFRKRGGLLGMSYNERWLLGINIIREVSAYYADLYIMQLFPGYLVLDRMLRIENFPYHGLVQVFFPCDADHCVAKVVEYESWNATKCLQGPSSLEMGIHFYLPSHDLHFSSNTIATFTRRRYNDKELGKHNVRVHRHGAVVNCGTCLVNYHFLDERPVLSTTKSLLTTRVWSVVKNDSDNQDPAPSSIQLEIGEKVAIAPAITNEVFTRVSYGLKAFIDDGPEEPGPVIDKPPLYVRRQSLDIEQCIDVTLRRFFHQTKLVYQGFSDYEPEIVQIEHGIAYLSIYCVAEFQQTIERKVENKFFVVDVKLKWDLLNSVVYRMDNPRLLQKVCHTKVYSAHSWYPLTRYPVEMSTELCAVDNLPMYSGKNLSSIGWKHGSFFISKKDDSD
ncbi:unnamed protein product, partial [Mesorhabditis spiculigera]